MGLDEQQKNGFMASLSPCIFPFVASPTPHPVPFWINKERAATKISGLHGRWALECLKISCWILSLGPRLEKTQLHSSCRWKKSMLLQNAGACGGMQNRGGGLLSSFPAEKLVGFVLAHWEQASVSTLRTSQWVPKTWGEEDSWKGSISFSLAGLEALTGIKEEDIRPAGKQFCGANWGLWHVIWNDFGFLSSKISILPNNS